MLWLFSLLATYALAQNCDVSGFAKSAQKRRECKSREGCKWSGRKEDDQQNVTPGSCDGASTCGALTQNQCKKRNNCYINWTANGRPCQNYNPAQEYPCGQLSGKKNYKKCQDQPKCINGSGDRNLKTCLDLPDNIDDQDCNNFSNRPNKNLCVLHKKCQWVIKNKKCVPKADIIKTCATIGDRNECEKNHSGCKWAQNQCQAMECDEIDDRTMCNSSKRKCQWYQGFNPDDFDHRKNKDDQRQDPNNQPKFENEGTCRDGISNCQSILVENFCLLAQTKYGKSGCTWNKEAKEINGATRCSTTAPCSDNGDPTSCQTSDNMLGDKCVWQKSGDKMRCMEFACDSSTLNTKNKCNTVGCHWHRNKDKRDPNSQGYCAVYDLSKGRRL